MAIYTRIYACIFKRSSVVEIHEEISHRLRFTYRGHAVGDIQTLVFETCGNWPVVGFDRWTLWYEETHGILHHPHRDCHGLWKIFLSHRYCNKAETCKRKISVVWIYKVSCSRCIFNTFIKFMQIYARKFVRARGWERERKKEKKRIEGEKEGKETEERER